MDTNLTIAPIGYSKLAITSIILAFIAMPMAISLSTLIGAMLGLVSFVLGIVALMKIHKTHQKGALFAWVAIIIGGFTAFAGFNIWIYVVTYQPPTN